MSDGSAETIQKKLWAEHIYQTAQLFLVQTVHTN